MSFEEICFSSNPNFRFQEYVSEKSDCLSSTCQFDCYKNKDGEAILISPFFDYDNILKQEHHICLINLKNNKVIAKLEGHNDRVITVRYFQDPETKKEYLISSDRKNKIIIWNLSNNYSKILEIYSQIDNEDLDYNQKKSEGFIYSCLLIFEQKKIWSAYSFNSQNNIPRAFNINNINEVINIKCSENVSYFKIFYLDYWYNKEAMIEKRHNIILCGEYNIIIVQFPKNTIYHRIETDKNYPNNLASIVFKNKDKDMLAFSSTYGLIQIFDLNKRIIIRSIELQYVHLMNFIKWNDRFLLVNDSLQRKIMVLDMKDDYKIRSLVLCPEMHFDRFIKKVDHPIYGESILSIGTDWKIKLFVNRNIIK